MHTRPRLITRSPAGRLHARQARPGREAPHRSTCRGRRPDRAGDEAADRVLLTGHTFLYNGGVRRSRTLDRTTARSERPLLPVRHAARTSARSDRDVNALWDLAPHDISIFNYLLDDAPQWVSAVGARVLRNGREDVGFITLGYPRRHHRPHPRELGRSAQGPRVSSSSAATGASSSTTSTPSSGSGSSTAASRPTPRRGRPPSASTTSDPGRRHHEPRRGGRRSRSSTCAGTSCTASAAASARMTPGRDGRDVVAVMQAVEAVAGATTGRPSRVERARHRPGQRRSCPVPFVDLAAQQRAPGGRELQEALARARSRGPTGSSGAEVERSSRSSRRTARCQHAVGVDSGLSALELVAAAPRASARATRSSPRPTRSSRRRLPSRTPARRPVLVDVDPRDPHARPGAARRGGDPRTQAIVPVHLYGQPGRDGRDHRSIADAHGLLVVEDACQAHGARYRGRRAGSLGRRGGVQLLPGEEPRRVRRRRRGRHATTERRATRARAAQLRPAREVRPRREGVQPAPRHAPGGDAAGQAAPPRRVERPRRCHAALYGELLARRGLIAPSRRGPRRGGLAPLRRADRTRRDDLRAALGTSRASRRASTTRSRSICSPRTPTSDSAPGSFPVTERNAGEMLSLPMYPELTRELVEEVVDAVTRTVAVSGTTEIAAGR